MPTHSAPPRPLLLQGTGVLPCPALCPPGSGLLCLCPRGWGHFALMAWVLGHGLLPGSPLAGAQGLPPALFLRGLLGYLMIFSW